MAVNTKDAVVPGKTIDVLLEEERLFAPSAEFVAQANVSDPNSVRTRRAGPRGFLGRVCRGAALVQKMG